MIKSFSILLDNYRYLYREKKIIIQEYEMIQQYIMIEVLLNIENQVTKMKKKDYYRDLETCNMIYRTFNQAIFKIFIHIQLEEILK